MREGGREHVSVCVCISRPLSFSSTYVLIHPLSTHTVVSGFPLYENSFLYHQVLPASPESPEMSQVLPSSHVSYLITSLTLGLLLSRTLLTPNLARSLLDVHSSSLSDPTRHPFTGSLKTPTSPPPQNPHRHPTLRRSRGP